MSYKVKKPCKVCGKMYTPCADCERDGYSFHWKTVACSRECGYKWFEMVNKARKLNTKANIEPTPYDSEEKVDKKTTKKRIILEDKKES